MTKAAYVSSQTDHSGGRHHCHWPGCDKAVPPAMWGCSRHWFTLPKALQSRIWATYVPGQEISKTPSAAYLAAADAVQAWINRREAARVTPAGHAPQIPSN